MSENNTQNMRRKNIAMHLLLATMWKFCVLSILLSSFQYVENFSTLWQWFSQILLTGEVYICLCVGYILQTYNSRLVCMLRYGKFFSLVLEWFLRKWYCVRVYVSRAFVLGIKPHSLLCFSFFVLYYRKKLIYFTLYR